MREMVRQARMVYSRRPGRHRVNLLAAGRASSDAPAGAPFHEAGARANASERGDAHPKQADALIYWPARRTPPATLACHGWI